MRKALFYIFLLLPAGALAQGHAVEAKFRLLDIPLNEITCEAGAGILETAIEASNTFQVPIEIVLGQLKQESGFINLGLTNDHGNYSIGVGQVNETEWLATADEPEIIGVGLEGEFADCTFFRGKDACRKKYLKTRTGLHRRVTAGKNSLNPRYNILALTAALRREYRRMELQPEASRDGFGGNLPSWLAVCGAYNGGPKIWSVIYNQTGKKPRVVNWKNLSAAELQKMVRTGSGYDADLFYRHSVARHLGMLAVWLNQPDITFCKLNDGDREVESRKCIITAEQKIKKLTSASGKSPACFKSGPLAEASKGL